MTLVTNTYAYVIVLRLEHKKLKRTEEHSIKVIAYSINDAILQAVHQISSEHNIKNIDDYEPKILFIGPDVEQIAKALEAAMKNNAK